MNDIPATPKGATATDARFDSSFSSPVYMTQAEAAQYLRISARTLERHRVAGTGPHFCRWGRRILYAVAELDAFVATQTFASTAEADAATDKEQE